jgi:hypothetical protein
LAVSSELERQRGPGRFAPDGVEQRFRAGGWYAVHRPDDVAWAQHTVRRRPGGDRLHHDLFRVAEFGEGCCLGWPTANWRSPRRYACRSLPGFCPAGRPSFPRDYRVVAIDPASDGVKQSQFRYDTDGEEAQLPRRGGRRRPVDHDDVRIAAILAECVEGGARLQLDERYWRLANEHGHENYQHGPDQHCHPAPVHSRPISA